MVFIAIDNIYRRDKYYCKVWTSYNKQDLVKQKQTEIMAENRICRNWSKSEPRTYWQRNLYKYIRETGKSGNRYRLVAKTGRGNQTRPQCIHRWATEIPADRTSKTLAWRPYFIWYGRISLRIDTSGICFHIRGRAEAVNREAWSAGYRISPYGNACQNTRPMGRDWVLR